ncbi:YggS family pyridoxal phosphate-dependent enzyme [Paludifilum halophilum]|uniref:Pyridoxal phosphate homeostasis protein n=1 Tax=Paludifilum halophilum TaxID=1642702 RepID=A0A235B2Y0_9BACL|nr:YggS family pyridoxal phosphate-dependent enzyme [Paludifilum halophilum]OYD06633.1 YggS family pyridoxal phosphate-dependent enzyme [Paludifilum halophilum]
MDAITKRWEEIQRKISEACRRSGRDSSEVNVVAVTKYVNRETTRRALDIGLHHIGESRVQEAVPKWEELGDRGEWHFIGHLQRNKVKAVVGRFTYLHSLDRLSLAKELNRRCEQDGRPMGCFLQVNVSGEDSKHGLKPDELLDFAREVAQMPYIRLEGLMTMAPYAENPEEVRPVFRRLKSLQSELREMGDPRLKVPHLSMGMSNDYEVAVEEGATYLRLGSALVGRDF